MSTSILHVSDTHLGKRQYKSSVRRDDFLDAFSQAIDIALGEHDDYTNDPVDAVLHTGDLFDDSEASLEDMYRCQTVLQRLEEAGIPFYAIIGNHERKLQTQFVDLYENTNLATRLTKEPFIVNDEVALYGIDAVRERAWNTTDFTLTAPDKDGLYKIVSMHQLISPPIPSQGIADYNAHDIIPRFGIDVDGLALGDYHVRTSAKIDGVRAWYPGSTERCALDESDARSVSLLEIDTSKSAPLNNRKLVLDTPEFISITVDFDKDDSLDSVRRKIESRLPKGDDTFNGEDVVIVDLDGEQNSVTVQQVYSLLESYEPRVAKVRDKRELTDFDFDTPESSNSKDINSAVEEAVDETDVGETARKIEDVVRNDKTVSKNAMPEEIDSMLDDIETGDSNED